MTLPWIQQLKMIFKKLSWNHIDKDKNTGVQTD